jgi:hypothetical protein
MENRWLFAAFDWKRYHELSPRIKALERTTRPDFDDVEGADDVLEEFGEEAPPRDVRNALLIELCTADDGALFESGLPGLLTWLRRQPRGEDPSETLAELISAHKGIEDWFEAPSGLVGLLTVEETSELARTIGVFRRKFRAPKPPSGIAALTRHFRTSEPAVEHLDELFDVVEEAAAEMLGLAAIRVE